MVTVKHLISGYEVLCDGRVKPSSILKFMQDAATVDANNLGADYTSMRRDDMIFVITKLMVRFKRMPMLNEMLEVRTWNGKIQGVSFNREFIMTVNGEEVARATTRWVLVSYSGRRILRPDSLKCSVLTNPDEEIGIEPERRIKPTEENILTVSYSPAFTDLDSNGHVNNTRYADFLVDYCGVNLLEKNIEGYEIHFASELVPGDTVEIKAFNDDGKVSVIGTKGDNKQAFASYIALSDK